MFDVGVAKARRLYFSMICAVQCRQIDEAVAQKESMEDALVDVSPRAHNPWQYVRRTLWPALQDKFRRVGHGVCAHGVVGRAHTAKPNFTISFRLIDVVCCSLLDVPVLFYSAFLSFCCGWRLILPKSLFPKSAFRKRTVLISACHLALRMLADRPQTPPTKQCNTCIPRSNVGRRPRDVHEFDKSIVIIRVVDLFGDLLSIFSMHFLNACWNRQKEKQRAEHVPNTPRNY